MDEKVNREKTNIPVAAPTSTEKQKLTTKAHLMCGWPLILVLIGGLIGGGLGGAAYMINIKIYNSNLPASGKIALNILTGIGATITWLVLVIIIKSQMQ
jgi:hypothetical protein